MGLAVKRLQQEVFDFKWGRHNAPKPPKKADFSVKRPIVAVDYRAKRSETIFFPFLIPSLNQTLSWGHWKRNCEHGIFQRQAGLILKSAHIQPFLCPVKILIDLCFKKKRTRDADNYAGGAKWLIDAIVKAGILPDDNTSIIPEVPDIKIICGEKENRMVVQIIQIWEIKLYSLNLTWNPSILWLSGTKFWFIFQRQKRLKSMI